MQIPLNNKMENQNSPELNKVLDEMAHLEATDPNWMPQPQMEVADNSTNQTISTEQKIAGFRSTMSAQIGKMPVSLMATLFSALSSTEGLINALTTKRQELMAMTEKADEREAIHYNFNIDVLIDRGYGIVDFLMTQRGEMTEGASMQPIHDAAIELAAVGLALANSLVVGMEITDNPTYQPQPDGQPAQ